MSKVLLIILTAVLLSCDNESQTSDAKEQINTSIVQDTSANITKVEQPKIAVSKTDNAKIDSLTLLSSVTTEKETVKLPVVVNPDKNKKPNDYDLIIEKDEKYFEPPVVQETESIVIFNHQKWDILLSKYVSSNGKVNYKGFKSEESVLNEYLEELKVNKPGQYAGKSEKLAYWINVYNAFTVKLILENYPLKSITDLDKPWDQPVVDVGKELLSLSHVENEILRKLEEPRIHFAINCASASCPILLNAAFVKEKMEQQLTKVTKGFIADNTKNDLTKIPVELSKIFDWYAVDFENGNVIRFINDYVVNKVPLGTDVSFKEYDWSLNE